jgi:hypothetical protein
MLSNEMSEYDRNNSIEHWTLLNADVREYKTALGKLITDGVPAIVTTVGGSILLYNTR